MYQGGEFFTVACSEYRHEGVIYRVAMKLFLHLNFCLLYTSAFSTGVKLSDLIANHPLQIIVVCNIHRPDFDCIIISILIKWLNRKDWHIRSGIKNNSFSKQFLTKLRGNPSERHKHSNQLVIEWTHQTIDFGMILCCAVCEAYFYVAS